MIEKAVYLVLFGWACWTVFSQMVNDGIVGRLIYSVIAVVSFAIAITDDQSAVAHLHKIMAFSFAAAGVRHFVLKQYGKHYAKHPKHT